MLKATAAALTILTTSSSIAWTNCRGLGIPNELIQDGAWLVSANGGGWQPTSTLGATANGAPLRASFAYVAYNPEWRDQRRGIVVVKTGVRGHGEGGFVELRRDNRDPAYDTCERYHALKKPSVSSRNYDRYHDYSYATPEDNALNSFHVRFAANGRGNCKDSNDSSSFRYFAGDWRSNRAQFSFDESVVAAGQFSQFFARFAIGRSYASEPLSQQTVTLKRYKADTTGLACVSFDLLLRPGSFVRISDLEADPFPREQTWNWLR